jgi:hypothetical protein
MNVKLKAHLYGFILDFCRVRDKVHEDCPQSACTILAPGEELIKKLVAFLPNPVREFENVGTKQGT